VFKRFPGTDTFIAKTVTALQVGLSAFRNVIPWLHHRLICRSDWLDTAVRVRI